MSDANERHRALKEWLGAVVYIAIILGFMVALVLGGDPSSGPNYRGVGFD